MDKPRPVAQDTFLRLLNLHKDTLYDLAIKMLGDSETAADVVQDVFLRFYGLLTNHTAIADPRSWLFISIRNACLNRIRDDRRQVRLDPDRPDVPCEKDTVDPRLRTLRKALFSLDAAMREIVILREYQELSYKEIADVLDITVPAVRSLLYKARRQLREQYEKMKPMRL